jgi:hypothetical protein
MYVVGISTGQELLFQFRDKSRKEGSIRTVVFYSHGFYDGVPLTQDPESGVYRSGSPFGSDEALYSNQIAAAMTEGSIEFDKGATIIFAGCNCGYLFEGDYEDEEIVTTTLNNPLAKSITQETGITTIASSGRVSPEIVNGKETGRLISDDTFYRFSLGEDGNLIIDELGGIIDPSTIIESVVEIYNTKTQSDKIVGGESNYEK